MVVVVASASAANDGKGDSRTDPTDEVEAIVATRRFRREMASSCKQTFVVVDDDGDGTKKAKEGNHNIKNARNLSIVILVMVIMIWSRRILGLWQQGFITDQCFAIGSHRSNSVSEFDVAVTPPLAVYETLERLVRPSFRCLLCAAVDFPPLTVRVGDLPRNQGRQ